MTWERQVREEQLDTLPARHPKALRSRRDLRRVHAAMLTTRALRGGWQALELPSTGSLRVLELGAGDGRVLLPLAQRLGGSLRVQLTLLDRQDLLDEATRDAYAACGWQVDSMAVDVLDWARDTAAGELPDLIVASLFLHHFEGDALDRILGAVAARTDRCLAFEPRRSRAALLGSHLIGALGVNSVTRNDAVLSVHAGFNHDELSLRWPEAGSQWHINERAAYPFGHLFCARRAGEVAPAAAPPAVSAAASVAVPASRPA